MLVGCVIGLLGGLPVLVLICLMAYFFIFNMTIAAITYAYVARTCEDAGCSLANMSLWLASLMMALLTQTLFTALTPSGTFILYGINCLICGLFCIFYLKEIAGLSPDKAKSLYRKNQTE